MLVVRNELLMADPFGLDEPTEAPVSPKRPDADLKSPQSPKKGTDASENLVRVHAGFVDQIHDAFERLAVLKTTVGQMLEGPTVQPAVLRGYLYQIGILTAEWQKARVHEINVFRRATRPTATSPRPRRATYSSFTASFSVPVERTRGVQVPHIHPPESDYHVNLFQLDVSSIRARIRRLEEKKRLEPGEQRDLQELQARSSPRVVLTIDAPPNCLRLTPSHSRQCFDEQKK